MNPPDPSIIAHPPRCSLIDCPAKCPDASTMIRKGTVGLLPSLDFNFVSFNSGGVTFVEPIQGSLRDWYFSFPRVRLRRTLGYDM